MGSWTIGTLLDTAAGYLKEKGSSSPRLDAELLLADTLQVERIHLYTQHDRPLAPEEVATYRGLIARRAGHEPVAYIRGRAHFRHLCLGVGPSVLIPRPETEELVDLALATLRLRPPWGDLPEREARRRASEPAPTSAQVPAAGEAAPHAAPGARGPVAPASSAGPPLIVDVGTGSGAIALALAQEAGVRVLAVDQSAEALAVARGNATALGFVDRVTFREGDLLAGIGDRSLALVVSNPPYVRSGDISSLAADIRLFEPVAALDGGPDGLEVYGRLLPEAARALRAGGTLLLEVGEDQAEAVAGLARNAGFVRVVMHKDLSRKDRMIEATLPGAPFVTAEELGEQEAAAMREALDAGAVIGVPTDTVYGIAARWDSPAGVRRLFAAKQRAPEQPVAVLFASVDAVAAALPDLDPAAARVLAALLPGPYTFVVATAVPRPERVGTPDSLGIRVPDHAALLRLLAMTGLPLAATSANLSGLPDAATAAQVDPLVLAHCSVAVVSAPGRAPRAGSAGDGRAADKGQHEGASGRASTVVDLRPLAHGREPAILREGAVSAQDVLERVAALG